MLRRKVRKSIKSIFYFGIIATVLISIFFIEQSLTKNVKNKKDYIYVLKNMLDTDIPVIGKNVTILNPFTASDIKVKRGYYNYLDDKEKQETALIFHDNTYLPNSGVDFGGKEGFDVVSILDGTVTKITEDPLLGKTIEIRHNNELVSSYQSLSEVKVKKDDTVLRGQVIGKSGYANIAKDLGNHLHFELYHNGLVVNPLDYFGKKIP
ncbi:MAG: peptidoglycan DD-metalloendopeptidase family protein [Bacilli bacterium]|jgi:stage II sporulation protein Q